MRLVLLFTAGSIVFAMVLAALAAHACVIAEPARVLCLVRERGKPDRFVVSDKPCPRKDHK